MTQMNHDHYSNDYIAKILSESKTIALVGASINDTRPSYGVMRYLLSEGYQVVPINPGQAGKDILGQVTIASLAELPSTVDLIDVFRASHAIPALADEILALSWKPKAVWMQLEVRDDASAQRLEDAGIKVVMNRCPAIEIPRLAGSALHY